MVFFVLLFFTIRLLLLLLLLIFPFWDGLLGSFLLDRVKTAELLADFGNVSALMMSLFPRDFTRIFGNVLIAKPDDAAVKKLKQSRFID